MIRKHPLALAMNMALATATLAVSTHTVAAEPTATAATSASSTAAIEVMQVSGKKVAYANNVADEAAKLSKAPIGNVMDLVNALPGVHVGQGDAYGSDDYTTVVNMRGFVIDRADQQIGITIDGIPNGGSAYAGGSKANRYLDSETTSMVEVGQGAADIGSASLDALGGTLNFVSATPLAEQQAQYSHSQGSFNARRDFVRFDTGQMFGNTTAYATLSNSFNNRWIGTGSNGYADRLHGEVKTVTELDNVKVTARLSYDDTEEDNYQPVSLAQFHNTPEWDGLTWNWTGNPDIDQNYAETWSTLRENTLLYVKTEWAISDAMDLTVTPYIHLQKGRGDWLPPYMHYPVDASGNLVTKGNVKTTRYTYVDAQGRPILDPKASTAGGKRVASYRHTHYDKDRSGLMSELRLSLGEHQLRGGVWVEDQQRQQTRDWHKVIDTAVSYQFDSQAYWVQFDDDYSTSVVKYYLQDQWTLGEAQLTLGVQQYLVDVKRHDLLNGRGKDQIDSDSSLLPSAGIVYPLSSSVEVFAGYSRNFKAKTDKLLETKTAAELGSLDPETADNLDVGLRYSGSDVSASLTLYRAQFDNRIAMLTYQTKPDGTPNYDAVGDGNFDNIGGVDANGVEASAEYRMTDVFKLTGALTLSRATYSDDVAGVAKDPSGKTVKVWDYKSGQKVAGSPTEMARLGLVYDNDTYRAGVSANYTGSYYGAAKHTWVGTTEVWNRDELPASTLLDLYVGYHKDVGSASLVKALDLNFVINNLTDKAHLTGGSEGAYLLGAGRSASITASLSF